MGRISHSGSHLTGFRFVLTLGTCLSLSLPAFAQNDTDPFAPNTIAPTTPQALPNAPVPTAPNLPPPANTVVEPAPVAAAPQPPAPAAPAPTPTPTPTPVVTAEPTPPSTPTDSSFFDKLGELFSSEETAESDTQPQEPETKHETTPELVEKIQEVEQPAPAPQVEELVIEEPATKPQPLRIAEPPKPAPPVFEPPKVQPYVVQADPTNKDPFAPSSVAPALPTNTPQAPMPHPVIVEHPAPEPVMVQPVVQEPAIPVVVEAEPTIEEPVRALETVEAAPSDDTSFFDKLGSLFQSENAPETVAINETPKQPSVLQETPDPSAPLKIEIVEETPPPVIEEKVATAAPQEQENQPRKGLLDAIGDLFASEEHPASVEPAVETAPASQPQTPEPVIETVEQPEPVIQEEPVTATLEPVKTEDAKPQKGLFDTLGNLFKSDKPAAPEIETVTEPTPAVEPEIIEQVVAPTPQTNDTGPFAAKTVAPSTPVDTPSAVQPVETVQNSDSAETKGFFERLGDILKTEEKPERKMIARPEPKPAPEPKEIPKAETSVVTKEKSESPGFFDRVGSFFKDSFSDDEATAPQTGSEGKPKAPASEPKPVEPQPEIKAVAQPTPKPIDPRLANANLGLGKKIKLGQSDNDLSTTAKCFTKNRGTVAYCLTPTNWPSSISGMFDVSSHLYQGTKGIVQYDGNIATRLFTLFKTEGFESIIKHYEAELGPATNSFERKTRTMRKGVIENPTHIWVKDQTEDGLTEVLEIRKIADTRGSIPDLQHGSIRVYFEGAREIFSLTSDLDYMDLR